MYMYIVHYVHVHFMYKYSECMIHCTCQSACIHYQYYTCTYMYTHVCTFVLVYSTNITHVHTLCTCILYQYYTCTFTCTCLVFSYPVHTGV